MTCDYCIKPALTETVDGVARAIAFAQPQRPTQKRHVCKDCQDFRGLVPWVPKPKVVVKRK